MSLQQVIARSWNHNHLLTALVELTYRCNLDCFYCYNDLSLRGRPLSRGQYYRLFEELAELQTLYLILSGGEPLAHPDFFLLGRRARELGFVIKVKSNGHALRGALARRLKDEVDPFLVEISLHGASPASHDRQTRVPGSFERLMANLPALGAMGLRVKLNCTLTAWNEHEVEAMYALADGLGLPLSIEPTVTPRDDGDCEPLAISASDEGIRRLFRLQFARAAGRREAGHPEPPRERGCEGEGNSPKQCGAGSSGIAVDPYGNVFPCVQWRRPLGNLHETSLTEIWTGSGALQEVRGLTVQVKALVTRQGDGAQAMAYCTGLAELSTGRPVGVYPAASRRLRLYREAWEQFRREATRPPAPAPAP